MEEELPCNHITVQEQSDPRDGSMTLTCPQCGRSLVIPGRDLMKITSARGAFVASMRIAGAFGEVWGTVAWQQLKPKDKHDGSVT